MTDESHEIPSRLSDVVWDTTDQLLMVVFDLLYKHCVEDRETPRAFVGLQGDKVVVMQSGGPHFGIAVLPAKAEVPA